MAEAMDKWTFTHQDWESSLYAVSLTKDDDLGEARQCAVCIARSDNAGEDISSGIRRMASCSQRDNYA